MLPGAQAAIIVGLSYYTLDVSDEIKNDPSRPDLALCVGRRLSRLMTPRLKELAEFVES
ncbi:MAG: hypothetical protein U0559_09395 [Anaerolineae bacterium]